MSDSFINQTSRVAIAGRVAEHHRPQYWTELTLRGDYHAANCFGLQVLMVFLWPHHVEGINRHRDDRKRE